MKYQELMMKSLADLLENGETLMYPIYGVLNQGNNQYYGFFGFTEKYLLIALLSGKQITYTSRIPLDIKSISINKVKLLGRYIVDISFNEGNSCKITISPKVLFIESQKNNIPLFLRYIKSKSPKENTNVLKDVISCKIRRQYFNIVIYFILAFLPMPLVMMFNMGSKESNPYFSRMIDTIPSLLIIFCQFLFPFIILSLLNRFFFGKIVSVTDNKGLYLENNFIPWNDIQQITFNPSISLRFKVNYTYATIVVKQSRKTEYSFDIIHFPMYGLRIIKKYHPKIKIKLAKSGLFTIFLIALLPTFIAVVIPLIR